MWQEAPRKFSHYRDSLYEFTTCMKHSEGRSNDRVRHELQILRFFFRQSQTHCMIFTIRLFEKTGEKGSWWSISYQYNRKLSHRFPYRLLFLFCFLLLSCAFSLTFVSLNIIRNKSIPLPCLKKKHQYWKFIGNI